MSLNLSLILFAIASTGTPGPNNLMILASGLNHGVRRSLPHLLGICTGVPIMILAVGFGLDQLFQQWPILFTILKVAGISYLLFLAWKIATTQVRQGPQTNNPPMTYVQAAAFQWVNPKAWVMVLSAVASFTVAEISLTPQILTIALTFLPIGLCCVGCWLVAGESLRRLLHDARKQRLFNVTMASLLVLSIAPMMAV
ncbi:LysE family translocator [Reinekea blandensis]|nr:LysE family translocator [Reinekea blandensis]